MKKLLGLAIVLLSSVAVGNAHFEHLTPAQNEWAKSLYNKGGVNCCTNTEGAQVRDPDWGIENGRYWVFLSNQRVTVPPEAVIEAPNNAGQALVWPLFINGFPHIKCFLPGSLS